jgi:hypothetical protein
MKQYPKYTGYNQRGSGHGYGYLYGDGGEYGYTFGDGDSYGHGNGAGRGNGYLDYSTTQMSIQI